MMKSMMHVWNSTMGALGVRHIPDILYHPGGPDVETIKLRACLQTQTYTCGSIAALMVARHFNPRLKVDSIFRKANADPDLGISTAKMAGVLRSCGVRVGERQSLEFRDIVDAIDRGRPILTVVNTDNPDAGHWVVIYGYGKKPNRVFLAANGTPLLGRYEYPWGFFRQHHWRYQGFGLICQGK